MQPLLPVFVLLVLLAILMPPVLLVITILRRKQHIGWIKKSRWLTVSFVFALIALSFNTIFVLLRLGEILQGSPGFDGFFWLAMAVTWVSFFGRIMLKSGWRHGRRLGRSRIG